MEVLFMFAHPDDAEIYSGGLLAKLLEQNIKFHVCYISNGQKDKRQEQVRKDECYKAMKMINTIPQFIEIEDGKVTWTKKEINRIDQCIIKNKPDLIITHNKNDYHYDHRHIYEVVHNIASYRYPILMTDTMCGNEHIPSYYCNISKYMTKKLNMIMCHQSQLKSCNYIDIVKVLNAYRALQYTGNPFGYYEGYSFSSNYHKKHCDIYMQKILMDNT